MGGYDKIVWHGPITNYTDQVLMALNACHLALSRVPLVQMKGTYTNLLSAPLACHVHY